MNVQFETLSPNDISNDMLMGFRRYTKTTHVHRLVNGRIQLLPEEFEEDWSDDRLREIASYLHDCAARGGTVIVGRDKKRVIAFANLEPKLYPHGYIHVPFIHVSLEYRKQGIGRRLFALLEDAARQTAAIKLYISTHPSVESQEFYQSVGCQPVVHIISELYDKEPCDIQLEKVL